MLKPEKINGKMYQPVKSEWCGQLHGSGNKFIETCHFLGRCTDESKSKCLKEGEPSVYYINIDEV